MEYFDLYTKDRVPVGEVLPRGAALPKGLCRLVVHVLLFDGEGRLLIQRRQNFKKGWSGLWDLTLGGSAIAGETSADAAERELFEELGIRQSLAAQRPTLTFHFEGGFDDFYLLTPDRLDHPLPPLDALSLQESEVAEVKWASLSEILSMIDTGAFIPYPGDFLKALFTFAAHPFLHTHPDHTKKS